MKSGDKVRYCRLSGSFEFGAEFVVYDTCAVLDLMTVVGVTQSVPMSEFRVVSQLIAAPGEWWLTRSGTVALVATVDDESGSMMVVIEDCESVRLELYYRDGRYSQSQETGLDLVCPAVGGALRVGAKVAFESREVVAC